MKWVLRSVLVRSLLVAVGASLAGWSLNRTLMKANSGSFSWERLLEGIALFIGLAMVWISALRASGLSKNVPWWQRILLEGTPAVLAISVFGALLWPLLA